MADPNSQSEEPRRAIEDIDRQIAEGIAAEERGELHDGEQAMAEIRAERGRPWMPGIRRRSRARVHRRLS